jgi:hypothetical protein
MKMQRVRSFVLVAAIAASVSCGSVVREGKSPVYLVIDELLASRGNSTPGPFVGNLVSDVLTLVTSPAPCAPESPCPTIFNDHGQVTMRISPKDIGAAGGSPTAPSLNNEVTITHYRVSYRRSDGRNTPGVDVPHAFSGGVTGTIPTGGNRTLSFELVRHIAKQEPPLIDLSVNARLIQVTAEVTFYGRDQVGNEISATGYIVIEFGDFGD